MLVLAQQMVLPLSHLCMLCIDILRSVPWTVVRPSGCFLLFLSCIVFLFSSAAALVANKDYYYYYYKSGTTASHPLINTDRNRPLSLLKSMHKL